MKKNTKILFQLLFGLFVFALMALVWQQRDSENSPYVFHLGKKRYLKSKVKFSPRTKSEIRSANFLDMDSPIVINEIGIAGPDGYRDVLGRPMDWIELYNNSSKPVSLDGYALCDNFKTKHKWYFPDIILPSKSSLTVTADGRTDVFSDNMLGNSNIVKGYYGWEKDRGFPDSFDRFLFISGNSSSNRLSFYEDNIQFPTADIWVRIYNPTNTAAELNVDVNGNDALPLKVRVQEGFQVLRIVNRDVTDRAWSITNSVKISFSRISGSVYIDTVTLTNPDVPFGEGEQGLHTDLSLKDKGELVALYGPGGQPVDYVSYPELETGQAYTRINDGKSHFKIGRSTMNGKYILRMPDIHVQNIFTNSADVVIEVEDGASVYYTVDGSEPRTNSIKYIGPFSVTNTTLVRCFATKDGAISSARSSKLVWKAPLPDMPNIQVVMDMYGLFSKTFGILRDPGQRGRAVSERPCYSCIVYPDGRYIETYAGIRIQGRSSRWLKERKGYRIKCRREYGNRYWDGVLFDGEGPELTESIVLGGGKLLDEYIGYEAMRDAGVHAPRITPAVMFMNNFPMGFRFIKEDPNSMVYLDETYGTKDLDVVKEKSFTMLKHGTMQAWENSWQKLADNKNYLNPISWDEISEYVNPMEFISWLSAVIYLSWGDNGQGYYVKYQQKDLPQWSFIAWDMDAALQGTVKQQGGVQFIEGFRQALFERARKNKKFSKLFRQRLLFLLKNKFDDQKYIGMLKELHGNMVPYYELDAKGSILELGKAYEKTPEEVNAEYAKDFDKAYQFLKVQKQQLLDIFEEQK